MPNIGKTNLLPILKQVDFGLYLDGGEELGEILLPNRYVPKDWKEDEALEVFLYRDSEDRLITTTETPLVQVDECAFLKVVAEAPMGVFLDWGLPKDLLVPFREQRVPMKLGQSYAVYVYLDEDDRIVASSKLSHFLHEDSQQEFHAGEEVELLIASRSDLGYKAVIEGSHLGLIHNSDIYEPIRMGDRMKGYIKNFTRDNRINLMLRAPGGQGTGSLSEEILAYLNANGGTMHITDKSEPEEIRDAFSTSKGAFKKALGKLYKERRITLNGDSVSLIK